MKIIHCSDIHLDSKMESNLSAQQAKERKREILLTFKRMVLYAKENAVKAIIIAGDLFDAEIITQETKNYLTDLINSCPEIDFIYLCGNHDENNFAAQLDRVPQNLKTFTNKWQKYSYGNTDIYGAEINSGSCGQLHNTFSASQDNINIVVLHGQIGDGGGETIINTALYKDKYIDYMALGHIHKYSEGRIDGRGIYCYSGCLEGRGFDETGEKGFVLLETEGNKLSHKFIPFAQRTVHEISVDISGAQRFKQVADLVKESLNAIPQKDMVKVILSGYYTERTEKNLANLAQEFKNSFYFIKFQDKTRLKIDEADYINDILLRGEFIRMVKASKLSPEEQDSVITYGLKALAGEEID